MDATADVQMDAAADVDGMEMDGMPVFVRPTATDSPTDIGKDMMMASVVVAAAAEAVAVVVPVDAVAVVVAAAPDVTAAAAD